MISKIQFISWPNIIVSGSKNSAILPPRASQGENHLYRLFALFDLLTILKNITIAATTFLVLLFSTTNIHAREKIRFDHVFDLGVPGGQTFLQDNDGFLWIGSDGGGIFRYDGYELRNYEAAPKSLSNGNVWRIVEDSRDHDIFWIGTSGGLNRFDKGTETFTYYKHDPNAPNSLGNNTVQDIVQDSDDPRILWLGTAGGGLNKFNKKTGIFTRYEYDPDHTNSIIFGDVWRIIEDAEDSNILWIGTYGGGLDKFEKKSETFTHYTHHPDDPRSLSAKGNNVDALIQDKDDPGILWIGTPEDGLDRFDKRTGKFTNYPPANTYGEVALIYDDGYGRLWLGGYVMNNGLTLFDKQTGTFMNYRYDPGDPRSLGNDLVVNVCEDRSGIFWITTYSGKVDKIDKNDQNFTLYQRRPNISDSLSNSAVTTIYEDRSGTIWIGTQGGLNKFDRNTETFTRYTHNPDDPQSLDADHILGIYEDSSGDFWISLYVGPLTKFDRVTGKVIARYETQAESLTKILEDPRNPDILWLGSHMTGLGKFEKSSETFTFYPPDAKHPHKGPVNNYVQELIHDAHEEILWLGGYFGGGLNKFDKRTERFTHYLSAPSTPGTLSAEAVGGIYQDTSGILWVGTKGGGLNKFDKHTETFIHYTKHHGMPTEVNSILEDAHGHLWLGTNKGIVRFHPDTEKVERCYVRSDGLQGNAFLHGSALRTKDDELWFGGTNGMNRFCPGNILCNMYKTPVVLTSLTQGGETVNWDHNKIPARLEAITLDWQHNFFEFEVAALNYTIPEKNQYKYMLTGYDKKWYYSGTRRFGRYSNLPGGTYTLRIMASNNDGIWSDKEIALNVTVALPWWETPWFRNFIIVFSISVLFGGFRWRLHVIRIRNRLLEMQVEERTKALTEKTDELLRTNEQLNIAKEKAEAANQTKSIFLANMSHELRSPLTAILGFTQLMFHNRTFPREHRENLDIIRRSGEHLLTLINQVLDFSKIDAGHACLSKTDFDLYRLLDYVEDMFRLKADKKRLQFFFERKPDVIRYIRTDEVKLRQVLINLLSNALKFTKAGSVSLRVSAEGSPSSDTMAEGQVRIWFEVRDSGPGIAPDELDSLFEAFVQTETGKYAQEGTGLGLSISRKFVQLMGGDIIVSSEVGQGTRFAFDIECEMAVTLGDQTSETINHVTGLEPDHFRYRVLIADDEWNNRQLLLKMLKPLGFELREAVNGQEAIERWHKWNPHLIWMDMRMPVMDGYEATKQIKASAKGRDTAVIALTASAFEEERAAILSAGCDDFMRKPFRENEIFDMMKKHIGVRYVYEESIKQEVPPVQDKEIMAETLAELSSDLLAVLEKASESGDTEMVNEVIADISAHNAALADGLTRLADNFAFEQILTLIQEAKNVN
ncbi:hybrid sensor histidine kinase/response regulator [Desulfonema magnum]|uniref:histidine kinase n=1 Tax=Desulfonema magnum TaxID=45655 RepID=A0A975BSG4_9BACT|nr:two-component regulator propeller domain-containing protein [Desulfonema magnum]QTA90979.1 Two-component system sensor histidine kinase/response regulator [Desulfonema magnum]